ncbi:unnamed protein product, partial [Prunus brigantina]
MDSPQNETIEVGPGDLKMSFSFASGQLKRMYNSKTGAEVTQRLSNAKKVSSKPAGLQSHEDLAKKLQVIIQSEYWGWELFRLLVDGYSTRFTRLHVVVGTYYLVFHIFSCKRETIFFLS